MPELFEFQEIIESHPVALAIACAAAALLGAIVTRWVDRRTLRSAHERLTAYEEEVRRLNDERAEWLMRLEERSDEVRKARAELARLAPPAVRPDPPRPDVPRPETVRSIPSSEILRPEHATPEVAAPRGGRPHPDWR